MATPNRLAAAVVSSLAALLLIAGCTATPGTDTPTSSPEPGAASGDDANDVEGVLLDEGRMFAIVTWGSSGCIPQVDQVSAEGQTVTVSLVDVEPEDGQEKVCTTDFVPRASAGALPEGVDPTAEITVQVSYGDIADDVELDGGQAFTGTPGESTGYQPSAGWFDDDALVLLTWGSSSCAPVVESVEGSGNAGTVTFVTEDDQVCTMDMAPRATVISFPEDSVDDDDFALTLDGGGLEGTVTVPGG